MRRRHWLGAGAVLAVGLAGAGVALRSATPSGVRTISVGMWPLSVAVDPRSGYAFVVDHSSTTGGRGIFGAAGSLSIVDTHSGTVVRSVSVGPDPRSVTVDDRTGRVFVANDDDASVSVLDGHSGAFLGSVSVGARPHGVAVDPKIGRAVVVNTGDGTVSLVDTHRGVVLRSSQIDGTDTLAGQTAMAVDARRDRAVIAGSGTLNLLNARSGAVLHTINVDEDVTAVAVDERSGHLFVATSGVVREIEPLSGRIVRTLAVGGTPVALAVDNRRDHLVVVSATGVDGAGTARGPGSVTIVNAASGAVLRTVSVGVTPVGVAVDEQSGHAVVVNQGGPVLMSSLWAQVPDWLRQAVPFLPQAGNTTRVAPGSVSIVDTAG